MKVKLLFLLLGCFILTDCTTITKVDAVEKGYYINQLHQGILLVRLRDYQQMITALRSRGQRRQAEKLRNEQKFKNNRIVRAFRNGFDFCPVYFFYSSDSKSIREGQLDSLILDWELIPVEQSVYEGKPFLVAEFAEVQPPSNGAGLPALIVLNDQLVQLTDPFPYYIRTTFLGEEDLELNAVKKLNEKLDLHAEKFIANF